jgi:ABC-type cobalt transport system substrate-binding protein
MADSESASNTGVVAIVVIFLIVVIAAFFAWRGGMFGGSKKTDVNIKVETPSAPSK